MGKGRAPCCDKSKVKRGPWSPAEDLKLITFIQKHGHDNWRALPKQAGLLRCGKSCRLRWINYLRPDVKRGNFTKEEEDTIIKLHQSLGNKWSKIASYLPGRTDNEIKNVWHTHLKKKLHHTSESNNLHHVDELSISSLSSSSSTSSISPENQNVGQELEHQNDDQEGSGPNEPHELLPSVLSNSSISSDSSHFLSMENHHGLGSTFRFTAPDTGSSDRFQEVDKPDLLEMPFDSNIDIWSLLDGLDSFQQPDIHDISPGCKDMEAEAENEKWFKYLENELELEGENVERIAETDNGNKYWQVDTSDC